MARDRSILALIRSLGGEASRNLYRGRFWPEGGGRSRRRFAAWGLLALAVFAFACALRPVLEEAYPTGLYGAGLVWNVFLLRAVVLLHAAWRTRAFALTQAAPAVLQQIALTPVRPRELVLGWALTGFCRAAPLSLVAFAAVAPLMVSTRSAGILIPLGEAVQWTVLQLLAALVAANQTLKFAQRREAIAAAWIASFITFPLAFFLRALFILGILFAIALVVASWIVPSGASVPPEVPLLIRPLFAAFQFMGSNLYWFAWTAATAFWGGVPLGALYEVRRQLDLAGLYRDEMRGYLELPPGRAGR